MRTSISRSLPVLLLAFYAETPLPAQVTRPLFDGRSLAGWEIANFGAQGPVEVRDGRIVLGKGNPITGITWKEDFPSINYEVTLEAMRVEG